MEFAITSQRRRATGMFVMIAMVLGPPAAWADEDSVTLSEIVVTAQRREENLQKTSLALQVVPGEQLKEAGLTDVASLETVVPGLQIGMAGSTPQIYIRGVGDFGATPITNPAVALNVDGVYIAKVLASGGTMFDLARVEVLKGPQGTLYGRNASGGAINFITNRPDPAAFGGYADVEAGNYGLLSGEGALNLPLNESFAVRVAAQVTSRRGYMSLEESDDHHRSARLQALWKSEAFSLLAGIDYSHLGGQGGGFALMTPGAAGVSNPWTSNHDPRFSAYYSQAAAIQGLCIPAPFFPGISNPGACPAIAPYPSPPLPPGLSGPYTSLVSVFPQRPWQDNDLYRYHAEFVSKVFGDTELTVLPAFQSAHLHNLAIAGQLYYQPNEDSRATSVEVRLARNSPGLKWVLGGYYYNQTDTSNEFVTSGLVQNNTPVTSQGTRAYAGFGQATFSVREHTRLIAGARYTRDRRDISGTVTAIPPSVAFLPLPGNPCFAGLPNPCLLETYGGADTFNKVTWKAGIEHDLTDENMLYATVSTGFKAGGFDQSSTAVPGSTAAQEFKPETLTAYELGSRNRFLDNRLQLNVEAFYWKYRDHQEPYVTIDGQRQIAFDYFNAGDAHQYGMDLDLAFRLTAADTLQANLEYLQSKYDTFRFSVPANPVGAPFVKGAGNGFTSFDPLSPVAATSGCATAPVSSGIYAGGVAVDCSGMELTHAPKWSGTLDYLHRFTLGSAGDLELRLTGRFAARRWVAADFTPAERAPSYVTEGASLTYNNPHKWSLGFWGRNLANKAIYNSGFAASFVASYPTATLEAPRTYGVRLSARF